MSTAVAKSIANSPAHVVRSYTQQVREHTAAMQRLQDQYFATLKRAEAQYFDGVQRIAEAMREATQPTPPETQPPATPA